MGGIRMASACKTDGNDTSTVFCFSEVRCGLDVIGGAFGALFGFFQHGPIARPQRAWLQHTSKAAEV